MVRVSDYLNVPDVLFVSYQDGLADLIAVANNITPPRPGEFTQHGAATRPHTASLPRSKARRPSARQSGALATTGSVKISALGEANQSTFYMRPKKP